MLLAKFLSKMFKDGGIILIDSEGQKYICGNPSQEKPLTLKLLKKDLNWKLLIYSELYLGEEYYKGNLEISKTRLNRKRLELEYGQSTSLEVLNAEVDFKNDSINYLNTISNLSNVKRDLNLIMNVDSEKMYDLVSIINFFLQN